eukprot:scpid81087/ scgid4534/ 
MVPGIWPSSGLWNGPVLCDFELVFRLHAARAQECTAGSHETEMVHLIESSLRVLSMWQGSAADLVRGLHSHCLHCTVVSMSTCVQQRVGKLVGLCWSVCTSTGRGIVILTRV